MFKRVFFLMAGLTLAMVFCAGSAMAHTPLCSCYDNGDGTITCEGGFSDGSSASGVRIRIENKGGGVLLEGKLDEDSEFSFDKPVKAYNIVFDGGEGHVIQIDGNEIVE
jgi:type 1 fimbria pilin